MPANRVAAAGLAAILAGCGGSSPTVGPAADWTAPPDWVTVTAVRGAIKVALPPWLRMDDALALLVFAIQTPGGVAWLQVTGPAASWPERVADVDRIALLLRVRSSSP